MDLSERKSIKKQTGKKLPGVPIKTYKWEDIRRARKRGGYPWTYLYKQAFDEYVNPEDFTMDGFRKSKTSSASSASDSLDIKEITEDDIKGLEGIDSSYVVIEGPILLGGQVEEPIKDQDGIIESADSSDNISQYLDKEDRYPDQQMESTETLTLPGLNTPESKETLQRARSEEPKRKRKLSIESNYSRISLSKLGVMKRLREAKDKIKFPKLGSSSKSEKNIKVDEDVAQVKVKKESISKTKTDEKPVYIHIPLKPPEGQTDEFSHLEFEEKQVPLPNSAPPEVQIEVVEDEDKNEEEPENEVPNQSSENTLAVTVPDDQDDDISAIIFLEGDEEGDNKQEYDIMVVDIDEASHEMKMSQVTDTEVRRQMMESIKRAESQTELSEVKETSNAKLSRTPSKTSKSSKSSIRKRRAKSAEPEKKRRSSIDSSYSRKSLSKIGFLKKLKEIHLPFKKSHSKRSLADSSITQTEDKPPTVELSKAKTPSKDQKPVYIHIPLKPPAGHTDEFSHLEYEAIQTPQTNTETTEPNDQNEQEVTTPDSPEPLKSPEFIVLTPPSDDEILDRPDIPETPSSETGSLFHFGELKLVAKNAIEQIHGPLEAVHEETEPKVENKDAAIEPEITQKEQGGIQVEEKVMIDEEDGLKSTQKLGEETKSSLKSNLKGEISPLPKKKVSFKRRKSSQVSKDDGYEEIESPASSNQLVRTENQTQRSNEAGNTETTRSKPEDEQKPMFDSTGSSSLEESHDKWSKMSDHEYEPVNPPAEAKSEKSPPQSHVSEVLNPTPPSAHFFDGDIELDLTLQEVPSNTENRFFNTSRTSKTDERITNSPDRSTRSRSKEKEPTTPNKFQTVLRESATKFKTKLQSIKKPNISLPSRPKFQKPNIKKPNIHLPKLPDLKSTFRRNTKKDEKMVAETQSIDSEEASRKGVFDFSTYPRLFKKRKQDYESGSLKSKSKIRHNEGDDVIPKVKEQRKTNDTTTSVRIPLHSEDSMNHDDETCSQPQNVQVDQSKDGEEASPRRYLEDIDVDDGNGSRIDNEEEERRSEPIDSMPEERRWENGTFHRAENDMQDQYDNEEDDENYNNNLAITDLEEHHQMITDLDQPENPQSFVPTRQRGKLQQNDSIDTNHSRDQGSSVSSLGQHRIGVLEEIDSDQFFLREKGISQDNIDMGRYLSTEIREAFRMPTNALADMRTYNYEETRGSNQSLPETKRKQMKKPKRKKTPHASQERLRYDQESEAEDYNFMPPIRPRRRSKRRKKPAVEPEIFPYTETYPIDQNELENSTPPKDTVIRHYENSHMEDKQTPNIRISEHYNNRLHVDMSDFHRRASEPIPAAPRRKHKSLKSLNASEHESIFDDYDREIEKNEVNRYTNGFDSSQTPVSFETFEMTQEPQQPKIPSRNRSKTRSMSRTTSQAESIFDRTDSIMYEEDKRQPIIEEPCIKDLRDAMGYAIIDKNQNKNWEHKFCTVPRSQAKESNKTPERPLRNYSTLGPSRPPRKPAKNMTDEEKENIDLSQYIEIEAERDLHSGEVIQKMQNRPLPAPPRPPRIRASKPLHDITSELNVISDEGDENADKQIEYPGDPEHISEIEVSTQTEPLPPDFVCEEVITEETDKIMTPSALRKNGNLQENLEQNQAEQIPDKFHTEKVLITPTHYTYQEETITHGQLLVEPLNGAKILPDSELTREKIVPILHEEEETSEIPDTFEQLADPSLPDKPTSTKCDDQNLPKPTTECVVKTQKLQVSDLDVDRLTVNELIANKIIVSDIESGSLTSHEMSSKSGTLKLADIEVEADVVKKILEHLKESSKQQQSILEEVSDQTESEQKKTSVDFHPLETENTTEKPITKPSPSIENHINLEKEQFDLIEENILQDMESSTELSHQSCRDNTEILVGEMNKSRENNKETTTDQISNLETEISSGNIGENEHLSDSEKPTRPPRSIEKKNNGEEKPTNHIQNNPDTINIEQGDSEPTSENNTSQVLTMIEPEVDDEPPPRPPHPRIPYIPSQPPPSFYALRAQHYVEGIPEDIPLVPRRKRHHRPATISRSSSSESNKAPTPRRRVRSPEPSIAQLSGQLVGACSLATRNAIKRLIDEVNKNIASNTSKDSENNKQNVQVVIVILLVFIAGLLLLGYGDGRTVHLHHWEFFNPPTDI